MSEPIDLAEIMADHQPWRRYSDTDPLMCSECLHPYDSYHGLPEHAEWPCLPYRLAEALIVERERVARVTACAEAYGYERIPLALDDRPYANDAAKETA